MLTIQDFIGTPDEKPLEKLLPDGGYTAIFRRIACIGDSLSSGEFQTPDGKGGSLYHDMFEYSWGQFMARAMGSTVYNFSRGGMRADTYMKTFAEEKGFWDKDKACECYILALGVNDITAMLNGELEMGTVDDVKPDWHDNAHTFAGYYAAIIQRCKEIQPDAKFFLMTIPRGRACNPADRNALEEVHHELIYALAKHFSNTYVLDFRTYAPVYDEAFHRQFFLSGHMNPAGYLLTAKLVMSYIDYIIRHNMREFGQVGLIGTPYIFEEKQ